MFSYRNLKLMIYIGEALLGLVLIGISAYLWKIQEISNDPLTLIIPAIIILLVGVFCVLFGVETYFFKDDPDIWR